MDPPLLNPSQYLALTYLFAGPQPTHVLRAALASRGMAADRPTFSRLARRLREHALVKVHRRGIAERESPAWENVYELTDRGLAFWQATRRFYTDCPEPPPELNPVESDYLSDKDFYEQLVQGFEALAAKRIPAFRNDWEKRRKRGRR
jgi:hypothetical protein